MYSVFNSVIATPFVEAIGSPKESGPGRSWSSVEWLWLTGLQLLNKANQTPNQKAHHTSSSSPHGRPNAGSCPRWFGQSENADDAPILRRKTDVPKANTEKRWIPGRF